MSVGYFVDDLTAALGKLMYASPWALDAVCISLLRLNRTESSVVSPKYVDRARLAGQETREPSRLLHEVPFCDEAGGSLSLLQTHEPGLLCPDCPSSPGAPTRGPTAVQPAALARRQAGRVLAILLPGGHQRPDPCCRYAPRAGPGT